MKSKVIFIAGLGHSGSTILDMSLGTLPDVVGLGELKSVMDDDTRERHYTSYCSCGKKATECSVWKQIPNLLNEKQKDTEKFEIVLTLLKNIFGENVCMVDSSKNSYSYLKYLNEKHDLKVLYLTRDIRSWSYSRHLATRKPILFFALRWYLENIKLRLRLKNMGVKPLNVGYEELTLFPEYVLEKIAHFVNLEYSDTMLCPNQTQSHIISGNIARIDKMKRNSWKYDARWMVSSKIMFVSPLFLLVQNLNRRLVYSLIHKKSIKDFFMFGTRRRKKLSDKYN